MGRKSNLLTLLLLALWLNACGGTAQDEERYPVFELVSGNVKIGFIDKSGNVVIAHRFDQLLSMEAFSEGRAAVKSGEKWGYINTDGEFVIDPQFQAAFDFSDGMAQVVVGDKWGYIDVSGDFVIDPEFSDPFHFSEGLVGHAVNWVMHL